MTKKTKHTKTRSKKTITSLKNINSAQLKSFLHGRNIQLKLSRKQLVFTLIFIGLLAVLYLFKGYFIAAFVNGRPVTRLSIIRELERQQGSQLLEALVIEKLILQEARKQNVTVSQEDIQAEIRNIEESIVSQNQTLDELLSFQGMTRQDLEKQIKIQKLIESLVEKQIVVTDEDLDGYIENFGDSLPENLNDIELREKATEQLKRQKIAEEFQTWIERLKAKANIIYFVKY